MTTVRHYIQAIRYFKGITEDELVFVSRGSVLREYVAGETIFMEGSPTDGLWIVERGHVKIYKLSTDGNEHILHLRGAGKSFNDISALDGSANPANATALSSQTLVWLVPVGVIQAVLYQNPQVALNVIQLLATRVRSLVYQIENLALYSVLVRLARFLLEQEQDETLVGTAITRTVIAAHLNTTPQTISTTLRELENLGAISFNRHQIRIIDKTLMRSIAML